MWTPNSLLDHWWLKDDVTSPVIAVVIPAFRAASHIQDVLAGIPRYVRHIVVVDDCSPDETADLVRQWRDPRVQLVSHRQNQGVGGAVLSGYDCAHHLGADVIVKMDSDDQMDPAHMPALISPIVRGEADYTKGNRFIHSRELRVMPIRRRIGNIGLSFLTKLSSGYWGIFDPTNGYTAIHASLVPMLDRSNIGRRYFFETSVLIELSLIRAVVRDVYIPAKYANEVSSLSERSVLFEFPPLLLRAFWRRVIVQYLVRDFSVASLYFLVGAVLTMFGVTWGAFHWLRSAQLGIQTPTGTVMLAVLPIILGIQLLLQALTLDVQNSPAHPIHHNRDALKAWLDDDESSEVLEAGWRSRERV